MSALAMTDGPETPDGLSGVAVEPADAAGLDNGRIP
jgi:hypothetical protein